jgi:hypothetical protein
MPLVSIVQEPVSVKVLAVVSTVPAIYLIVPVVYLNWLVKVVLTELISILLDIYPVQPAGKDIVPVPTKTIFAVPDITPVVRLVDNRDSVFRTAPVVVFSVNPPLAPVDRKVFTVRVSTNVTVAFEEILNVPVITVPLEVIVLLPTISVPLPEYTVPAPKLNPLLAVRVDDTFNVPV